MRKFLSDLFSEKSGGKASSKKFWGHVFLLFVGASYIADGLKFYEVNADLFNPLLIAGCTLIGLRTIGGMFKGDSSTAG